MWILEVEESGSRIGFVGLDITIDKTMSPPTLNFQLLILKEEERAQPFESEAQARGVIEHAWPKKPDGWEFVPKELRGD